MTFKQRPEGSEGVRRAARCEWGRGGAEAACVCSGPGISQCNKGPEAEVSFKKTARTSEVLRQSEHRENYQEIKSGRRQGMAVHMGPYRFAFRFCTELESQWRVFSREVA